MIIYRTCLWFRIEFLFRTWISHSDICANLMIAEGCNRYSYLDVFTNQPFRKQKNHHDHLDEVCIQSVAMK